jgi:hypothetical protein
LHNVETPFVGQPIALRVYPLISETSPGKIQSELQRIFGVFGRIITPCDIEWREDGTEGQAIVKFLNSTKTLNVLNLLNQQIQAQAEGKEIPSPNQFMFLGDEQNAEEYPLVIERMQPRRKMFTQRPPQQHQHRQHRQQRNNNDYLESSAIDAGHNRNHNNNNNNSNSMNDGPSSSSSFSSSSSSSSSSSTNYVKRMNPLDTKATTSSTATTRGRPLDGASLKPFHSPIDDLLMQKVKAAKEQVARDQARVIHQTLPSSSLLRPTTPTLVSSFPSLMNTISSSSSSSSFPPSSPSSPINGSLEGKRMTNNNEEDDDSMMGHRSASASSATAVSAPSAKIVVIDEHDTDNDKTGTQDMVMATADQVC